MYRTYLFVVALVLGSPCGGLAEEVSDAPEVARLLHAVRTKEWPDEAYQELFESAGASGAAAFVGSEDASVAIQAAWQRMVDRQPLNEWGHAEWPTEVMDLSRFVGFIEGRARLQVPEWWRDIVVWGVRKAPKPDRRRIGPGNWLAPDDLSIQLPGEDGAYLLEVEGGSCRVSAEVFAKIDGPLQSGLDASVSDGQCFLAACDVVGYSTKVVCMDCQTGALVWEKDACGAFRGGASGQHEAWVSVTAEEGRVAVFGGAWTGFYLHVFDKDSGETLLRFSTGFSR